jgi:hypothetical protein
MPPPRKPGWAGTSEQLVSDPDDIDTLPDVFGSDLAQLFDYCRALLGQDADAARTARSVVDSALPPQQDPDHRRARFFALGRRQALALRPPGGDEPAYLPLALIAASDQLTDNGVLRAFRALTDGDREILDLVYRHGIRPATLPEVLGTPTTEAYRRLAVAEEEFLSLASEPDSTARSEGHAGAKLEDIAALPFAAAPAMAAPPATRRWHGDRWVHRRPAQFVAAAVITAATIGTVVYLVAAGHPTGSQAATLPGKAAGQTGQQAGTRGAAHAGRSGLARHRPAAGQRGSVRAPVASLTTVTQPKAASSGAVITGIPVTAKPEPCPAGTKANFRWHYTANGSAGGWSGTATQACPATATMGPQAMDGNLQLAPDATLKAGYDFTLPGDNNSVFVTSTQAKVTFKVKCANGMTPTTSTVTVPMPGRTYQSTNGGTWYPSGDQSSLLVYQGSISVPNVCNGGTISFQGGGTFSANIS